MFNKLIQKEGISNDILPISFKTTLIALLLLVESFFLTNQIVNLVNTKDFFVINTNLWIRITMLMILLALTIPFSIGVWNKSTQYLLVPIPLMLGIALNILYLRSTYIGFIVFIFALIVIAGLVSAANLKDKLIKYEPYVIFYHAIRHTFTAYAIIAVAMLMLSAKRGEDFNIIDRLSDMASKQVVNLVKPSIQANPIGDKISNLLERIYGEEQNVQEGLNADTLKVLQNLGYGLSGSDAIQQEVATNIRALIEPYRLFVLPFIGLLIFGIMQFLAFIARLVFAILIGPLTSMAINLGFLHIETISVEKQVPTF